MNDKEKPKRRVDRWAMETSDLIDECEELERERDNLKDSVARLIGGSGTTSRLTRERNEALDEVRRLKQALYDYGEHEPRCRRSGRCVCGLEEEGGSAPSPYPGHSFAAPTSPPEAE